MVRSRHKWAKRSHRLSRNSAIYEGSLKDIGTFPYEYKYAIVVAKFNSLVTKELLYGAQKAFNDLDARNVDTYWVPGSFELPFTAKKVVETRKYIAVVCLGAVIRGGTSHYDAVVSAATSGILQASVTSGLCSMIDSVISTKGDLDVPVIFGVLTCDTMEQALDRAGGKMGNKGYEAAITAMEMVSLKRKI